MVAYTGARSSEVKNARSSPVGAEAPDAGVLPATRRAVWAMSAEDTTDSPPTATTKPGTVQPGSACTLEQNESVGSKAPESSCCTESGSAVAPAGTSSTGTASWFEPAARVAVLIGASPVSGARARAGAAVPMAAPFAAPHHGPAPSASGHPSPAAPFPDDAAIQTMAPAYSSARPVGHHPPRRRAISTLVS